MKFTTEQLNIIDIDVHIHVFGYTYRRDDRGVLRWHDRECKPLEATHAVPQYTRDWNAMGEVLTELADALPSLIWQIGIGEPFHQLQWVCHFRRSDVPVRDWHGAANLSAPLAVALAALKAKGIEVKL